MGDLKYSSSLEKKDALINADDRTGSVFLLYFHKYHKNIFKISLKYHKIVMSSFNFVQT